MEGKSSCSARVVLVDVNGVAAVCVRSKPAPE